MIFATEFFRVQAMAGKFINFVADSGRVDHDFDAELFLGHTMERSA